MGKPLIFSNFLSEEICQKLINDFDSDQETGVFEKGMISQKNADLRKGRVEFLPLKKQDFACLLEKLLPKLELIYGLKGLCFKESFQLLKYESSDHFGSWHKDVGEAGYSAKRLLTLILPLSEFSAYTGGELEFRDFPEINVKNRGALVVFPSTLVHRVNKVTSGSRFSLVIWVSSP